MALVYERTRSLLPAVLDHATNNALAAASDLLLR
jgi:membrane protease YdiL (CAAX protease family)